MLPLNRFIKILFPSFAFGQLLDSKLYVAAEFVRKAHELQFFRFFSGVAVG